MNVSIILLRRGHPITQLRMKSHIVVFHVKELPDGGFQIDSASAIDADAFPDSKPDIKARCKSLLASFDPESVMFAVMFIIEAVGGQRFCEWDGYKVGEYSDIALVQETALIAMDLSQEDIARLNEQTK
jgi:hypothetical protein